MKRHFIFKLIAGLVLVGALVGLTIFAYNTGLAQGAAQSGQLQGGRPFYAMPFGWHFFGGFGLLSCLVPLFLLCLFFAALRGLFWHGPRHWRHMHAGPWGMPPEGDSSRWVPPMFAEWHRRAHEQPEKPSTPDTQSH